MLTNPCLPTLLFPVGLQNNHVEYPKAARPADSASCFANSAAAECGYFRKPTESATPALNTPRTVQE